MGSSLEFIANGGDDERSFNEALHDPRNGSRLIKDPNRFGSINTKR